MRDIQLILGLFASRRVIQRAIHQRAETIFKDDRVWDVMVTHKAGAAQSTSDPICILSNLTRLCHEKISNRGGDRDIVKQMNAAFRKPALIDRDEGKHFTIAPLASEGLLCKEGDRRRKGKMRVLHPSAPSAPLRRCQELCVKNPAPPFPVRGSSAEF